MSSPLLSLCLTTADRVEFAADRLGRSWPGHAAIVATCRHFRESAEALAGHAERAEITIAFIGPKNAGKSTVAGLLIQSEEKRGRLKAGRAAEDSTVKLTWVGAQPREVFDPAAETFIPCHESEFVPLGFRYALVDVPGFNESHAARSDAALRALDRAVVKVLVVDRRSLESGEIEKYLERADGATLVPVVNLIGDPESQGDFSAFEETLRRSLRHARVLPRIEILDHRMGADAGAILAAAGRTLAERLAQAVSGQSAGTLAEPQLAEKLRAFREEIAALARTHLPTTRTALLELDEAVKKLPAQAVEAILVSDRHVGARISGRFRSVLLDRTPLLFFPWRLALSIANLVHGATDRLPLLMLGSIPSLVTTAWAATKNLQQARELAQQITSGLREHVTAVIKDRAAPHLERVDFGLRRDLGDQAHEQRTGMTSTANLRGLETLQARSAEIFLKCIDRFAPSAAAAWFLGFVGFALFWSVFGWPVFGLYTDFAAAAAEVLFRQKTSLQAFPAGTFSMLATSAVLAVLPMALFLLCSVALVTRRSRVARCAAELCAEHEAELQRLTDAGHLAVELSEPQIDACHLLLTLGRTGGDGISIKGRAAGAG